MSDGKHPHNIAFIQCVGSRCSDDKSHTAQKSVVCIQRSTLIRDKYPDVNVTVFYIDVRPR